MGIFPRIQNPCPYSSQLATVMDGDFCTMCRRNVVSLDGMSDGERRAFFKGCTGDVCVSYRFPAGRAMAAALTIAAVAAPSVSFAQDVQQDLGGVFIGGIKDPANVEFVEDVTDAAVPQLPVIYDDKTPPQRTAQADTTSRSSGRR